MNTGKTVFSQLIDFMPQYDFDKCVSRYKGNRKIKTFTCKDQFLAMCFAQLTYRESLRDIETCLNVQPTKLYHMGFRCKKIDRSTLSKANENRNWKIYADFANILTKQALLLYKNDNTFTVQIEETAYAFDSTTIDLCLSLFPWAKFRKNKAAVKMHTLLDLRGNIPSFIEITEGLLHDVNVLDILITEPNAFYIIDKGYTDFTRLYKINQAQSYFIIRAKDNLKFQRIYSRKVDKSKGLLCDQTIRLTGKKTAKQYPEYLRRVKYHDSNLNKTFVFLTNNFAVDSFTIAQLYKKRWEVELFFKWVKQHLRIKAFYGRSENAVKTQCWIAITVYLLVAIIKKTLKIDESLYAILQILSLQLFEKVPVNELFSNVNYKKTGQAIHNQLTLW